MQGPCQEASGRKTIGKWPKDHSGDILTKNVAGFCSFPKNLHGAKMKSFELIVVAEGISRQSSIDCVM